MQVVATEAITVFHDHVPHTLAAGQVASGSFAAMLLERAPAKVRRVDTPAAPPPPEPSDPTAVPDGTREEVLAWVGTDPERARRALDAERAGRNRKVLAADLERLAGPAEQTVDPVDGAE